MNSIPELQTFRFQVTHTNGEVTTESIASTDEVLAIGALNRWIDDIKEVQLQC